MTDITNRAPISNPPPLTYTFIPDNLKSAKIDPAYMDNFLVAKVASGCINGPFSIAQAHSVFGGHFHTTPPGLVEKPGSDALCMICHHSKKDCYDQSTNGWLDTVSGVSALHYSTGNTEGSEGFGRWLQLMRCA